LRDAFRWVSVHPQSAGEYVSTSAVLKLLLLVGIALGTIVLASLHGRQRRTRAAQWLLAAGAGVVMTAAAAPLLLADGDSLRRPMQRRAALFMQMDALFERQPA